MAILETRRNERDDRQYSKWGIDLHELLREGGMVQEGDKKAR